MLTDFVSGSSLTLVKNPNYWRDDPLHPGDKLPYIDKLTWLIMPDQSTRIAAIRTAKIDLMGGYEALPLDQAEGLIKTNPELRYVRDLSKTNWSICQRVDLPNLPTRDVRVRKALAMAIDRQAILREYYRGNAELVTDPVSKGNPGAFTPYEQLPPQIKELFEYHPDKAKQLLAEAGYPNGFKASVLIYQDPEAIDLLSIVKDYWSKVGVDLNFDLKDYTVFKSIQLSRANQDMFFYNTAHHQPHELKYTIPDDYTNTGKVNDPVDNEARSRIWAFENMNNYAERDRLLKEAALHDMEQMYWIQMPAPYIFHFWQPWVQNYHGEHSIGASKLYNFPMYIWLDQDMKQAMTGRR